MAQLSRLSRLTGLNRTAFVKAPSTLLTTLSSYWTLSEAGGSARPDSVVASANDLTDHGSVGQASGPLGNAASFTTGSQYLTAPDAANLRLSAGSFTIDGWVYFTNANSFGTPLSKGGEYWLRRSNATANLEFFFDGLSKTIATTDAPITLNTWLYFITWYDNVAHTLNLRVNNGTLFSTSATTGGSTDTGQLYIGAWALNSGFQFAGRVQDVGIWKRVLTSPEQAARWNGGSGLRYPF